jgi:TonB family protein
MKTGGSMRLGVRVLFLFICISTLLELSPVCRAQQQEEGRRKMVTRVVPLYPNLAQKMGIAGSVKIEAVVAPNGTVKSAAILGGHPVLAQAGLDAVQRCKWEPSTHETKETVILNFHPQ